MKNIKGYEINLSEEAIIITKKFSKAAGVVNSDEYKMLLILRKDFPDFKIKIKTIEKRENKVTYSGLSICKMKAAIFYITQNKDNVTLFEKYIEVYKDQKGKYATLKKLFLDKYKEEYNALDASAMAEIDKLAKEYNETDTNENTAA